MYFEIYLSPLFLFSCRDCILIHLWDSIYSFVIVSCHHFRIPECVCAYYLHLPVKASVTYTNVDHAAIYI